MAYPFDWGFVPSTRAADGNPLDVMLLWDVSSYPGVVVPSRAIGVLQVEQNQAQHDPSARVRNDRIMAIPLEARRQHSLTDVTTLSARVRQELEQFAVAATVLEGKDVEIVGWGDASTALKVVQESALRHGRKTPTTRRRARASKRRA